uniref:Integrase catalytic domain-containing protein n=1 Tax=Fagus sylvatica TaxID=28930 RepID=A0A2N9GHT1_FAGSY
MTRKIMEAQGLSALIKQADPKGWTPLDCAAYFDSFKTTELLLGFDRNLAYMEDANNMTALRIAAHQGHHRVMEKILSSCPDCYELVDNKRGWNALHFAVNPSYCPKAAVQLCRVDKMAFNRENLNPYNIALKSAELPNKKSRADDSERVIAELRQEINDLKKTAKVQASKGGKERSDKGVSERRDKNALPPIVPKKKVRRGEQGAVWKALDLVSSSPFIEEIEQARLPERFTAPRLEVYNGRTNPVAHIGHYHHRMALWHHNDPLMCRMFPSSLGEVALRWFNQIKRGTIGSWNQMAEVFVGRFITNSRRSKGLDTLMVIKLGSNESLKDYSARFWETYNDIDGCAEDTALQAFKLGLPPKEDGGSTNAVSSEAPVQPPSSRYQGRTSQASKASSVPTNYASSSCKAFQTVFKEPIQRILDKIKGKPFFVWPSKLIGDPEVRNQNLYCFYHRDKGHLTENCHKYKAHLEQLVTVGHLSDYIDLNSVKNKARGTIAKRSGAQGPAPAGGSKAMRPGRHYSKRSRGRTFRQGFMTITDTSPERAKIVAKEVDWLLEANAIRPVQYPTWLSNTVVVKKKNGKWRVCVDFTDLNKAYSKDPFPLPRIDQLVDSASGHERMRATYQRMVTVMFGPLIGKTVEVYIDDMLIKSVRKVSHIEDLREVLRVLRSSKLRLNASKCLFGVSSGKFLGHMVQRLTGMIAALGRFISRSVDKCRPFFRLLGKKMKFLWDEDCSAAFQGIKTYLSSPPCLSIPCSREPLFLYLAVSEHAVSAILVRETHEGQKPVFFVSKTMDETESRYLPLEKAALALIQAAKKLPHYFQASTVTVLTDLPLKVLMHSSDFSGWVTRWGVEQIRREHNSHAYILAKLATALESNLYRTVTVEVLSTPSILIDTVDRMCSASSEASWMDPLIAYLRDDCLPEDPKAASIIKRKAPSYWLSREGNLYKRSFSGPYLLCVHPNLGYWCPYMQSDAVRYVRKCDKCQRFAPRIHQPAWELNLLSSPWPFAQWSLDIVGPLPQAPGNKKFLIVATDYFTKWIEAEPLTHIREVDTKRFLWKRVVTRFGIPWAVISDNGTQFEGKLFKGLCSELGIRNFFSSPGYPQSNGQAEVSNKVILDGIKKRLEEAKGKWVEKLPSVMWTHRTPRRRSIGETPFALAYGVEAIIPLEVGLPTTRTTEFDTEENECNLRKDLNLLEERRDMATIRLASYQHQMKRGYDKNIRPRSFQVRDLVLRKVVENTRNPNDGKLGPNWEGPYKVTSFAGVGAYRLIDMDGKSVLRP